jgi:DNA sulfur modification protein DndC
MPFSLTEQQADSQSLMAVESVASMPIWMDIKAELSDEYLQPHEHPWIIGFSGGKDSTLVTHLVFEMLLTLPPSQRRRAVHIVSNDTLVESPLVITHLKRVLTQIEEAAGAFGLPITCRLTRPDPDDTFWVNLLGRGYPAPNRSFRWCTDRMKIQPTSRYIQALAENTGRSILLLGVRRAESATRAGTIARYDNGGRLNRHNDLATCYVYRPISELSTEEVWEFLGEVPPPWGGSHSDLIMLYRNSEGGECPIVTQRSDAPSCGTSSSRFGCWTCTVVEKDRSLEGFIDAGFTEFAPLVRFRDMISAWRNDPEKRQAKRRNGTVTVTARGTYIPGPFTPIARRELLDQLLALQDEVGQPLISAEEIARIRAIWAAEITGDWNAA